MHALYTLNVTSNSIMVFTLTVKFIYKCQWEKEEFNTLACLLFLLLVSAFWRSHLSIFHFCKNTLAWGEYPILWNVRFPWIILDSKLFLFNFSLCYRFCLTAMDLTDICCLLNVFQCIDVIYLLFSRFTQCLSLSDFWPRCEFEKIYLVL